MKVLDTLDADNESIPEAVSEQLAEMERLQELLRIAIRLESGDNWSIEASVRLRRLATQLIALSMSLVDPRLDVACQKAVKELRRKYGHLTAVRDWDDAWQETRLSVQKQQLNLASNTIDDLDTYAFQVMEHYVIHWRKRATRQKSLASLGELERTLAAKPEVILDSEQEFDALCVYLDRQIQPNPDVPLSRVLRIYQECSCRRTAADKLGISQTELVKYLKAIRELVSLWMR